MIEQAKALLTTQPVNYEDFVQTLHSNGLHDVAGIMRFLRQDPDVSFQVTTTAQGQVVHTVRKVA